MQNIKTHILKTTKILLLTLVGTSSLMALDIETYYDLDIKAMQMSLEGSKERLACIQASCPLGEQYAIDDKVQEEIEILYENAGTTPSKHIGFYTQNAKEAQAYYDNDPTLQETYRTLTDEIEAINSQLKTLMEVK